MKGAFFIVTTICVALSTAHDWHVEYNKTVELVMRRIALLSPRYDPHLLYCRQGPSGWTGPRGFPGAYERNVPHTHVELKEELERLARTDMCNVEATVENVVSMVLEKARWIDSSLPSGPPGPIGPQGFNAREEFVQLAAKYCLPGDVVTCPFINQVLADVLPRISKTTSDCPDKLEGAFGPMGERGEGGFTLRLKSLGIELDYETEFKNTCNRV